MPDLIIKPTATSGNKLILKDQAGGVVLQTSDSGVSHLSTPSGHVIKTTLMSSHPTNHTGGGSGDTAWDIANTFAQTSPVQHTQYDTTNYFKYTPLSSSNKLIIHYSFGIRINPGTGDGGYGFRWRVTPSGGTEIGSETGESTQSGLQASSGSHPWYRYAITADHVDRIQTTFYFEFGSAVNHEFKFYVQAYDLGYLAQGGIYGNTCQLVLQEIQG